MKVEVYYKNLKLNDNVNAYSIREVQLSQLKFAEGWKNFMYYTFKLK